MQACTVESIGKQSNTQSSWYEAITQTASQICSIAVKLILFAFETGNNFSPIFF